MIELERYGKIRENIYKYIICILLIYFLLASYYMNIAVIFGSRSTEHDVSIISGLTVVKELHKLSEHTVEIIYISKEGTWEIGGNLNNIEYFRKNEAKGKEIQLLFTKDKKFTVKEKGLFGKTHIFDLVMPITHGMNGEDGTLQGLLEMTGVPYTGSKVLGSALGMDKIAMKDILSSHKLPQVKYVSFYRNDWQLQPDDVSQHILQSLQFPIFIKPANLGSSIGITRATDKESLEQAIEVACYYDSRVICEEGVEDLQEINCAVRGNSTEQKASLLEEPVTFQDFLTFEEKYINSGGTMQGIKSKVKIPAQLPNEKMTEEIQEAAKQVFKVLNCSGIARIDFLVDKQKKCFYVNEINTIPGSLQNHLWKESGISFSQLLEDFIENALDSQREKEKNSFAFQSNILQKGEMKK